MPRNVDNERSSRLQVQRPKRERADARKRVDRLVVLIVIALVASCSASRGASSPGSTTAPPPSTIAAPPPLPVESTTATNPPIESTTAPPIPVPVESTTIPLIESTTAPPIPVPVESTTIPPIESTTVPTRPAPAPITVVVSPALRDEGQWRVLGSTAAGPVLWGTTVRPFAAQPDVRASYATFDQTRLHAALFNGTELPGVGPWNNGSKVMPAAIPSLLAAFNGGFKFKHIKGGYFAEGRVIKPLLNGEATLAINSDGRISIGVYGVDLTNDGSWLSLRQNLPLIIDRGHETVSTAHEQGVASIYWGDDFGGVVLDFRSAICQRSDGLMMYAVVGKVDINGLVKALIGAHCQRAMELDINGSWPQFVSVDHAGTSSPQPNALDPRMTHLTRYLTVGSTKDFIALFDPLLLPPNVVR